MPNIVCVLPVAHTIICLRTIFNSIFKITFNMFSMWPQDQFGIGFNAIPEMPTKCAA